MGRAIVIALVLCPFFCASPAGAEPERPNTSPRAAYQAMARKEAESAGLPPDVADAVMAIESGYDPTRIGGVGEIGLMQVRPTTASMLGFSGSVEDLARPEINIHYGVTYLAAAWRLAHGDLCRALMKYRAGHGEDTMSPLSVTYCGRAQAHLAARGSPWAAFGPGLAIASVAGTDAMSTRRPSRPPVLRGAAFWAAHEARVKAISAQIERRWKRVAQVAKGGI